MKVLIQRKRGRIFLSCPNFADYGDYLEFLDRVDNTLKVYDYTREFTALYKAGADDGYVHLLHRDEDEEIAWCLPGFLPKIREIAAQEQIVIHLVDYRCPSDRGCSFHWDFKHQLRAYQVDAIQYGLDHNECIIQLPTGAGKTVVGLRIIQQVRKTALILVTSRELFNQWADAVREILGIEPGLYGNGKETVGAVTIAMLQTLQRRIREKEIRRLPCYVLISDEAHHLQAEAFREVAIASEANIRIGLTATPEHESNLKNVTTTGCLHEIYAPVTDDELIENEHLVPPTIHIVDYQQPTKRQFTTWAIQNRVSTSWQDLYKFAIQEWHPRNQAIVQKALGMYFEGEKVYVHVTRIEHGEVLQEQLAASAECKFIHGSTPHSEREEVIKGFVNGDYILVSTLLKEGVNIPHLSAIIYACAGKSKIQLIQTIGRALRPAPGKETAHIVDFHDRLTLLGKWYKQRLDSILERYNIPFDEILQEEG